MNLTARTVQLSARSTGSRVCLAWTLTVLAAAGAGPMYAQVSAIRRSPEARVNDVFAAYNRPDAPGCAVAVMQDGRVEYSRGYGMADVATGRPITPATPFYAASTSKQFTAFAVLLLASEGRLSLDEEVQRYVPGLPDFGARLTIRQLLHHTSGLRDYFGLLALRGWRPDDTLSVRGFLDLVSAQRALNFPAGARHLYSNTGYVLLSLVVERASGESLRAYTTARVFGPLRMTQSAFRDDHRVAVGGVAMGYEPSGATFRPSAPAFDVVGDGGLFTTVQDLARWESTFLYPRPGLREAVGRLGERGVLANGDTVPYAMGLQHGVYRGLATLGHTGAYAGYRADFTRFPQQRFSVAVLCNRSDANPAQLSRQVADIYLERSFRGTNAVPHAGGLAPPELAGVYWNEETETIALVSVPEGRLVVAVGGNAATLTRADADPPSVFSQPSTGTRYEFGATGTLSIARPLWPVDVFQRIDSTRVFGTELVTLAGNYDSPELAARLVVTARDSVLLVRWGSGGPAAFTPLFGKTFSGAGGLLVRFAADGSGLTISNGRTQRVVFTRTP